MFTRCIPCIPCMPPTPRSLQARMPRQLPKQYNAKHNVKKDRVHPYHTTPHSSTRLKGADTPRSQQQHQHQQ